MKYPYRKNSSRKGNLHLIHSVDVSLCRQYNILLDVMADHDQSDYISYVSKQNAYQTCKSNVLTELYIPVYIYIYIYIYIYTHTLYIPVYIYILRYI